MDALQHLIVGSLSEVPSDYGGEAQSYTADEGRKEREIAKAQEGKSSLRQHCGSQRTIFQHLQ